MFVLVDVKEIVVTNELLNTEDATLPLLFDEAVETLEEGCTICGMAFCVTVNVVVSAVTVAAYSVPSLNPLIDLV